MIAGASGCWVILAAGLLRAVLTRMSSPTPLNVQSHGLPAHCGGTAAPGWRPLLGAQAT